MSLLTMIHVALSLLGIATGFLAIFQMIGGKRPGGLNVVFLATTILTSVTGFFFPITKVTPGLVIGTISLVVLAIALFALYSKKLAGNWRMVYVVTAVMAQFCNVLVLVVQSFQKIPALHVHGPTDDAPIVKICQLGALLICSCWAFSRARISRKQLLNLRQSAPYGALAFWRVKAFAGKDFEDLCSQRRL